MKKYYAIFNFGRHSDLLNLAFDIKNSLDSSFVDSDIFCNQDYIDGEKITDLGAKKFKKNKFLLPNFKLNKNTILHSLSPSINSLFISIIGKFFGCKVIYNVHRFDFNSYTFFRRIGVFIYTFIVFLISDIVYIHIKNRKKFLFWSKKIIYAELPEFNTHQKKINANIAGEEVLFFGRIDSNKGLNLLYKIIMQSPNIKYRIAGELVDNSLSTLLKKISALKNVNAEIRRIESKELSELFQNTMLVILPYSDGTQSGIPYLARSLITPVLVADVGELALTVSDDIYGDKLKSRKPEDWINIIETTDWHNKRVLMSQLKSKTKKNNIYLDNII